jgi:uncharacterized RDD family membrane protein YckC
MTAAVTNCGSREERLMSRRKAMKLASRGKRFGAACIDMVIPAVSCFIALIAAVMAIANEIAYGNYGYGFGYGYGYGYNSGPSAGVITALIISMLLSIVYLVIQLIFFNKSKTMGKAALGLQVVSSKDGEPIGFWKMLFREWIVKGASGSVFLLGFIWILIDDRNRGWHDKILDTYVVDLKESEAMNAASGRQASAARPVPAAEPVQRPEPKSAPVPVTAVPQKAAGTEPETAGETVTADDQPSVIELPGSVLDVADVVVETAKHAAAETADKTEYDTVNARTDELDEQK